jgi:hypothetical protein
MHLCFLVYKYSYIEPSKAHAPSSSKQEHQGSLVQESTGTVVH